MIQFLLALIALTGPATAHAANDVALSSEMFVERAVPQTAGAPRIVLEKPKSVPPGAHLVFVLSYRNQGKAVATNFTVTNPMPSGVAFDSALDPGSIVSADAGKSWGSLGTAQIRGADGALHAARPDQVTHVRWVLSKPIPVSGSGTLRFRGTVK